MNMISYTGLRQRDSYNEILNYIQTGQPKIKFTNRYATVLFNTPQYSSLLELDGMNEQEEQIKRARVAQSVGETQLTQYFNLAGAQHTPHPFGPAAQSVAGSAYSDPGAFTPPGHSPIPSSHGAPNENPSDYASVYGSDLDEFIDEQENNIQHQQAQSSSIAQSSLDVQPMVPSYLLPTPPPITRWYSGPIAMPAYDNPPANSHPSSETPTHLLPSSGYNPKPKVKGWNANPRIDTSTPTPIETSTPIEEEKPLLSAIPTSVKYSPKTGAIID